MKSRESDPELVEKLYSLTLLVNEAVDKDASHLVGSLLDQRGKAIEALGSTDLTDEDRRVLRLVSEVGSQIEAKLQSRKGDSLTQIQEIATTKSGLKSYQKQK